MRTEGMSDVKRYEHAGNRMCRYASGDYVLHSDYEALERENEQYKKWLVHFPDSTEDGVEVWQSHMIGKLLARIATLKREKEEARDKALEDGAGRFRPKGTYNGEYVQAVLCAMKGTKP